MEMDMLEKIDNFGTLEKDEVAEFRSDVELMMEQKQKTIEFLTEITMAHIALMDATCNLYYEFEEYRNTVSCLVNEAEMSSEDIERYYKGDKGVKDSIYDTNRQTAILEELICEINYLIDDFDR